MFLKNSDVEFIVRERLEAKGLSDTTEIAKDIMAALLRWQKVKGKKGFDAAKQTGKFYKPKKTINLEEAKKQKDAGVKLKRIAKTEGVSEQTLRRRLKEV